MIIRKGNDTFNETIEVEYNPYIYELKLLDSTVDFLPETNVIIEMENHRRKPFHTWYKEFIRSIKESLNSSSFKIVFNGREEDFLDLKEEIDYLNENGWNVDYELKEFKENNDIIKKLEEYVENIQKDAPKELLKQIEKKKAIKEFEKAKDNNAEISIIATMSSGKSTLLNAILGKEILPARNQACTATICDIKDVKDREKFIVKAENLDGKEISSWEEAVSEKIEKFNEQGNTEGIKLFIEGNIKGVKAGEMQLVLIDTPGPNNSLNMKHKEATYKFIKDTKNNPLVLYVMNTTQQGTTDDAELLKEIAKIIKENGKQAEERFIFALNKIDNLDTEKESIDDLINNCIEYLKEFGIESPKIFPISAEFAKLIRLNEINEKMSRKQEGFFKQAKLDFLPDKGYEGIDTIKYASINDREKQRLYEEAKTNDLKATLNYSGISAIELYIDKYVNKYAKTQKVKDAISTLKDVVDAAYSEVDMLSGSTQEELKKLLNQTRQLERVLKVRGKAKIVEIENQIKKIEGNKDEYGKYFDRIEMEFIDLEDFFDEVEVSKREANRIVERTIKRIKNLFSNMVTSAEESSRKEIENKANEMIQELKKYFIDLLEEVDLSINLEETLKKKFELDSPNVDELLEEGMNVKKEYVGKECIGERWSPSIWPWTWFNFEKIYVDKYEEKEYFNLKKIANEFLSKQKIRVRTPIIEIQNKMDLKIEEVKENALNQLNLINIKVDDEIELLNKKIKNQQLKNKEYEEYEKDKKKIIEYKKRLDNILNN